jgi:hypothetical protein
MSDDSTEICDSCGAQMLGSDAMAYDDYSDRDAEGDLDLEGSDADMSTSAEEDWAAHLPDSVPADFETMVASANPRVLRHSLKLYLREAWLPGFRTWEENEYLRVGRTTPWQHYEIKDLPQRVPENVITLDLRLLFRGTVACTHHCRSRA